MVCDHHRAVDTIFSNKMQCVCIQQTGSHQFTAFYNIRLLKNLCRIAYQLAFVKISAGLGYMNNDKIKICHIKLLDDTYTNVQKLESTRRLCVGIYVSIIHKNIMPERSN